MIDTDKYEGHTPAPWMKDGNNICDTYGNVVLRYHYTVTTANHTLIADAPTLLQEVKRYRLKESLFIEEVERLRKERDLLWDAISLSGAGCWRTEEIAFWHEELLNMNEAELKKALKEHYGDD